MSTLAPSAAEVREADSLGELAARINAAHEAGELASRKGLDYFRRAGEDLLRAKEKCGHGKWLRWLKEHVKFDRRTATNYIRLASKWETVSHLEGLRDALKLLVDDDDADAETPHVARNSGENEWYTPPEYLAAARAVLGEIDLDPASSAKAQESVQAAVFFDAEDDGLSRPWAGRVWLNPPYAAELVGQFVSKLCEHFQTGDVPAALLLVNNATETDWFQAAAAVCSAACFPDGRVKFLDSEGNPSGAPLQGQAVLYFGVDEDAFVRQFKTFGACVKVIR